MDKLSTNIRSLEIASFMLALQDSEHIEAGFEVLAEHVTRLGFDAVSYTAIPRSIGTPGQFIPVFLASADFSADFITHYDAAALWQSDFTIERIMGGHMANLDWWEMLATSQLDVAQNEVIQIARYEYGIRSAITIPTQSDRHIVAGASLVSDLCSRLFTGLKADQLVQAKVMIIHFHHFVFSRVHNRVLFYRPVLNHISPMERKILKFLVTGRPLKQCEQYTGVSPTRAGNIRSSLFSRLHVKNASELAYLIGHHQILSMFE